MKRKQIATLWPDAHAYNVRRNSKLHRACLAAGLRLANGGKFLLMPERAWQALLVLTRYPAGALEDSVEWLVRGPDDPELQRELALATLRGRGP